MEKFTPVFALFAICHDLYDRNFIGEHLSDLVMHSNTHTQTVIHTLSLLIEDTIHSFLAYYRRHFPSASITLKLHLMEDHMIPFLRQMEGVSFGLLGEQGAEHIHHEFNMIRQRYANIPDRVEQLRCVMREHHLRWCPPLATLKPLPKKRKSMHTQNNS